MMKLDLTLNIGSEASTEEWVQQSRLREVERQKRQAEERERRLREEEEELVNTFSSVYRLGSRPGQSNGRQYTSADLKGLKVRHDSQAFEAGSEVILTLADTSVLATDEYGKVTGLNEEEDDILENVNISEHERKLQRDKQRKRLKQPLYSGYDDDEFAEGNIGVKQSILPQYEDEEMKKKRQRLEAKIVLGEQGTANLRSEDQPSGASLLPNKTLVSLSAQTKIISDVMTKEEVKFRKTKRSDKKRNTRVKTETEEDAESRPAPTRASSSTTTAVRKGGEEEYDLTDILGDGETEEGAENTMDVEEQPTPAPTTTRVPPVKAAPKKQKIAAQAVVFEDEDEEFAAAMRRAREIALKNRPEEGFAAEEEETDHGAKIAAQLAVRAAAVVPKRNEDEDEEIDLEGRRADGKLIFNSTMEFASRLQAVINDRARSQAEEALRGMERERERIAGSSSSAVVVTTTAAPDDMNVVDESKSTEGAENMPFSWEEIDEEESTTGEKEENPEDDEQMAFLHRQPLVAKGMAATLELLKCSGELNRANELAGRAKDSRSIDPSRDEQGVKIEYRDEFGRKLTQKEAFRQLSYKFHGYGPGKKKLEKRLKQHELEVKAQKVRSGVLEGVAGTMRTLTKTQEATGKAHLVVPVGTSSGAGQKK